MQLHEVTKICMVKVT